MKVVSTKTTTYPSSSSCNPVKIPGYFEFSSLMGNRTTWNVNNRKFIGNYNTISGDNNHVIGNHNNIYGDHLNVIGNNNDIYGDEKTIKVQGLNNKVNGVFVLNTASTIVVNNVSASGVVNTNYGNIVMVNNRSYRDDDDDKSTSFIQQKIIDITTDEDEEYDVKIRKKTPIKKKTIVYRYSTVNEKKRKRKETDLDEKTTVKKQKIENDEPFDINNNDDVCIICMERKRKCAARPCNHLRFCNTCCLELEKQKQMKCPVCRLKVDYFESFF